MSLQPTPPTPANELFQAWQDDFLATRLRIGLVSILVAISLFATLDLLLIPEARWDIAVSYSWHYLALAICTWLIYGRFVHRHPNVAFICLVASILIVPQVWVTFGGRAIYNNSSWLLVILGLTLLVPIRPLNHLLLQVATLGYHLLFNRHVQLLVTDNSETWILIYTLLQLGVICAISDISILLYERLQRSNFLANEELRQANHALQLARNEAVEANTAKSNFLASMSHELRTPLNAIIGYSEMLYEEVEELAENHLAEDVGNIQVASQHLLAIINNVLDLAKIEAGRMTLSYEHVAVAQIVQDVQTTMLPLFRRQKNEFVVENHTADLNFQTDWLKVRQILLNLLNNANKFTHEGRITLRVTTNTPPTELMFQVCDTGIGMNEAQVERLFTAFYQAQQESQSHEAGTGLGLVISQQFCQMLGGRIHVTSTPTTGTIFTVTLPLKI